MPLRNGRLRRVIRQNGDNNNKKRRSFCCTKWVLWMGMTVIGLSIVALISSSSRDSFLVDAGLSILEYKATAIATTLAPQQQEEQKQQRDVQERTNGMGAKTITEILATPPQVHQDTLLDKSDAAEIEEKLVDDVGRIRINDETTGTQIGDDGENNDSDCPFKNSSIYRKVYVYPNYGDDDWKGDILSEAGQNKNNNVSKLPRWPWLDMDEQARLNATGHYNIHSQNVQYTTELLVREIMINPRSCLRTFDPEEAVLFYVPYLPSIEHHRGQDRKSDYSTSPYGEAIMDILDKQNYTAWENTFGLTSKYWKRRQGADHILVFSEPMHGLYHPRMRRGNFHFIHSQKQLTPAIVISVELSTTFVEQYPKCAAKNILMPYPNTDGKWFNGQYQVEALALARKIALSAHNSTAALPAERALARQNGAGVTTTATTEARPVAQFYSAGKHGTCRALRVAMTQDYKQCAPSYPMLQKQLGAGHYGLGMRLSTFCPCPGGDSPSAKRHFDAILANCIPIILSHDFVWPFTTEFDPEMDWNPNDFALRLQAKDYDKPLLNSTTCQPNNASHPGLQAHLESISAEEIQRLRKGMERARYMYSWYEPDDKLVENPLREGVLPTGGAAHTLVKMLAKRAKGALWPACEEELKQPRGKDARQFKC